MSDTKLTKKTIVSEEIKKFSPIRAETTSPYEIVVQAPPPVELSEELDIVVPPQILPEEPDTEPGPTGPQGEVGPQGFQGIAGGGDGSGWINPAPTLASNLEGIPQGTTFPLGTSSIEILETLLYPYQSVSFSSFSIGIGGSPFEVGQTAGNGNFNSTWTVSGPTGNWISNSLQISGDSGVGLLASDFSYNDSPRNISHSSYRYTNRQNLIFRIQGEQEKGSKPTALSVLSWRYRYFHGKGPDASYDGSNLLQQGFATTLTRTTPLGWVITFSSSGSPKKAYVAIPQADFSSGNIRFINTLTTQLWPFLSPPLSFNHTNIHGTTIPYFLYESSNEFEGSVTLRIEENN